MRNIAARTSSSETSEGVHCSKIAEADRTLQTSISNSPFRKDKKDDIPKGIALEKIMTVMMILMAGSK